MGGRVLVPFCGIPFCTLEGVYCMRTGATQLPHDANDEAHRRGQAQHFIALREQLSQLQKHKEEILKNERREVQIRAAKMEDSAHKRLNQALVEQTHFLEAEEKRLLDDANQKVGVGLVSP